MSARGVQRLQAVCVCLCFHDNWTPPPCRSWPWEVSESSLADSWLRPSRLVYWFWRRPQSEPGLVVSASRRHGVASCRTLFHILPACMWFTLVQFLFALRPPPPPPPAALPSTSLLVFSAVCGADRRSFGHVFLTVITWPLWPLPVSPPPAADAPVTLTNWWLIIDARGGRERRCQSRQVGLYVTAWEAREEDKPAAEELNHIVLHSHFYLCLCLCVSTLSWSVCSLLVWLQILHSVTELWETCTVYDLLHVSGAGCKYCNL